MKISNIKNNTQGFTIVELLIVVVVIAILAAITIVSYNGITNRANQSAAKAAAGTAQKKIELYNSENGRYPVTQAELSGTSTNSWYLPGTAFGSAVPVTTSGSAQQGTKYVQVRACKNTTAALSTANVSGAVVTYWNYGDGGGAAALVDITLGTCTGTDTSIVTMPAS